jgi:6-phosphogluconate dehydrogenase
MAMELITEEVYKIDKSDKQEEAFRNSSLMKNLNELNLKTFLSDLTNLALQPLKESLENPIIKETMDKLANIILVMQIYLAS